MISSKRNRIGRRRRKSFQSGLENLEPRIVLDSTVVFNEIMYNPMGENDSNTEWIELFNQLNVDMDISEWQLTGAVEYSFPDGTVVPGRGHLVVASNPQALADSDTYEGAVGPWEGQLSNAGEELLLYNNDGRLMNAVQYDDSGDWPAAADGGGSSLAKADAFAGSHLAESWTFSPQVGGTIGFTNFIKPGTFRSETVFEDATVRAIVPTNGDLGLTWTAEGFDDSSWTSGTLAVGHEGRDTYDPFLGLDLDAPPNGQTPLPIEEINGSVYMRIYFDAGDVSQFDRMQLRARYDDGFVAFLNGVEIASANAPGRNGEEGELSWNSTATRSHRDSDAVVFEGFDITEHRALIKETGNVLAVHGMNQSVSGNDSLFDFEINGDTELFPAPIVPLAFNEIAAFDAQQFFVELTNTGSEAINLNGMTLTSTDSQDQSYVFGDQPIAPGAIISVSEQELGFRPGDTERLVLKSADQQNVIDARRVTARLRGRSEQHDGAWLYPTTATPGEANAFQFEDDIVINEIMYHPHPMLAIPDIPPQYDRTSIIELESEWRYNATGAKFETGWAEQTYAVDNENWLQGQAVLGYETSRSFPFAVNTEFTEPRDNDPPFVTYYFQTDFELSADDIASIDTLELNHVVDDGAIFYLNGVEVHRYNLVGQVDADTGGQRVGNADRVGPEAMPVDLLRVGTNVVSVEVHNRTATDSDIVFGAELIRGQQTAPLIPGTDFRERSEEEWIELYNKGAEAVDLTGWRLRDAVGFDFPEGTMIESGEHILVARDAEYLREKYPDVRIIGSFSGGLSDHDDNILLLDANENPADEVHYYEGGQWPSYPDGGAVSLELTDPNADNSKGGVWAASDDSSESEWTSHTFRGTSLLDIYGNRASYHEFLFGLLGPGEFLIDDVEVVRDPGGAAIPLMQNGTFENDTVGQEPDKWRLIGNHTGVVIADPTDAGNKVLHVTAEGAMAHVHDHAETTFANDERIADGTEYELSFRAKWVAGSSQLNSRLWFNRLSNTMRMDVTDRSGTPGEQNSRFVANAGPVYAGLQHGPTTPAENEEVTIQVQAEDPDNVVAVKLFWRLDRNEWNTLDMSVNDAGNYQAVIPGHSSGDIIQFYVEGQDGQGAVSMFPADGPESRALYQVDDGRGPSTPIDSFRMIMMDEDNDDLFRNYNVMSNWYKGITLIHNDTVFYDVDARLIGSRFIRPNSGYKLRLNPDQPFYGVHDSIRFDLDGLREIVLKQLLNRTGGSKSSQYDDIGYLLSASRAHSHEFLLQLARYENLYLNEQFENGGDGTKFELDDVTVPNGGRDEELKTGTAVNTGQDIGGNRAMVRQQGANPEFYRAHVLIKSNRAKDDYASIARLAQAIHTDGDELFERTNELMDVDLWMRHYAHQSFFGAWDTYGFGRPKNLRMFVRPSDEKVIPLMWDCDRCPMDRAIKQRTEATSRLDEIRDIPHNLRVYWGHMNDFMNTSFTNEYTQKWAAHFSALAAGRSHGADGDFNEVVSKMERRIPEAIRDMERDIPRVDFAITTNDGNDLQVDQPSVMLEGKGWVDIRYLRLAGTEQPLTDVFWPEEDSWQVSIPLAVGGNEIAIEAIDYRGNLIGTETINVTSTEGDSVSASLRVAEVYYHPSDPTAAEIGLGHNDADEFEFIEFTNIGSETISLSTVSLVKVAENDGEQGVDFDFVDGQIQDLAPGASVLVVENLDAFQARFGDDMPVAGQWSGGLGNGGEKITVENAGVVLQQFTYDDAWYPATDGNGRSLQILDTANPDLASWNGAQSWRPSSVLDGTPGNRAAAIGDSNGDGLFDSSDLSFAFQSGEYEDDIPLNSTFAEGDWNGDGDFTTRDIVWVFMHGVFDRGGFAARPVAPVSSLGADNLVRDQRESLELRNHASVTESDARLPVMKSQSSLLMEQQTVDTVFAKRDFDVEAPNDLQADLEWSDRDLV